jgi:glycosyltransferase involved in cell wall biosynthesis
MKSRKITIVFLTKKLNGGGAERSLLEIFRVLNRKIFSPVLWRLDSLNFYPEYLANPDSTEVLPPWPKTRWSTGRIMQCRKALPRYLRKSHPDSLIEDSLRVFERVRRFTAKNPSPVVLVSSQLSMNVHAAIVQWLCRYRLPVVFIEQNEPYMRYKSIESSYTRDLAWNRIRQMYPRATHVVTVSEAARKSLHAKFGVDKNRVTCIPNPVCLEKIRPYLRRRKPSHPFYWSRWPVIVCTARFHLLKNHLMLLRSFALLRKTASAKLILLGQGPQHQIIKRTIAEMGLERDVSILDFRSQPFRFVAHADVSVLASYSEGQGLAVVESLACGVPVVCTNWQGVRELIQPGVNGIVCHMRDDALAAGLLAGLGLAKVGAARTAAKISARKFDLPKIIEKYEALFLRLARPSTNIAL